MNRLNFAQLCIALYIVVQFMTQLSFSPFIPPTFTIYNNYNNMGGIYWKGLAD